MIDPDNPSGYPDSVRISLLQLSCLLVSHASPHIHDASNKKQGSKLRRLMTFAWPCLLTNNCVDPTTKYHGHLLLAHIIAKFAIHKKIVLQVFHSLLKAHAQEAKLVVRQALEILTPAMPQRMEDGNSMLTHWTRKIMLEEGHTVAQLVHILQLVVRHHRVYYPIRHALLPHMVNSITKLGFTGNTSLEHRKLTVDLAEVIMKWESQRVKEENDDEENNKPIDKIHTDAVVNFLLRFACQINDSSPTGGSTGELLSRRCVSLLKTALNADMWPNTELKLAWFDKLLLSVEASNPNISNICTALELLTFLLGTLRKEQILTSFKPLQRGIAACMTSVNSKVIRSVHGLLSRLMSTFPTEPTSSSIASKYEELENLYAAVGKVIYEGLTTYDKNSGAPPSTLFSTLMILKAACVNNACYIDRLITTFMRVLQRLTKEHLSPSSTDTGPVSSELLILSLDLVKNRVGVMGLEMRKAFIGSILVGLIEKSPDVKVLKAITKMVEEWVKCKNTVAINQGPSVREKSILLVRMMSCYEKRFGDDADLMASYLQLIVHVYRDESLKGTELTSKLELAFMCGLRCTQPHIREQFFDIFDKSMRRRLHDRLLYIVCSQNWETMGPHFWIKQCLQLLLVTAQCDNNLNYKTQTNACLPAVSAVIYWADQADRDTFNLFTQIKDEPSDAESIGDTDRDIDDDLELSSRDGDSVRSAPQSSIHTFVMRQVKFLESNRNVPCRQLLNPLCQLIYMDTDLAHDFWIDLYPKLWSILSEKQQQALASEMVPFLCSGAHVVQKECSPSALNTFIEGLSRCVPSVPIKPCLMRYLGKSHNIWHRMILLLEQVAFHPSTMNQLKTRREAADCYEFEPVNSPQEESLAALAEMYAALKEEDLCAGLWAKRAKYPETVIAISCEQHGLFERAQGAYELAMSKCRADYSTHSIPHSLQGECKLWEEHWIRCSQELNQWDLLLEYGNANGCHHPLLVLEATWRVPNWTLMKQVLTQVEMACPQELAWKVNLYRGYLAICHPEEHHLNLVERLVEVASGLCIKQWRRLPFIVSYIHLPLLQAAQQVMELQEAAQIHQGLLQGRASSLHDMKAIVKTWRNRLPVTWDDLKHWNDIFTWRQHHYQFIVNRYEQNDPQIMLGVHASAQAIIHFGKMSRKHHLTSVCLESLSRIHTIASVPIIDCFQKIRQQVKCYLQLAQVSGKQELTDGLEVIESTNLKYFPKDMTAEFYAIKGMFLHQLGRGEEANKAFSAAAQLDDKSVRAWVLWGDYLEQVFSKEPHNLQVGASAIICFLHACRQANEPKNRKYLPKVLWLLTYDDEAGSLAEAVQKFHSGIPSSQWVPWVPQLLTCLVRRNGNLYMELLTAVGRVFPQSMYFPIRTLYLTLKIEQRERYKSGDLSATGSNANAGATGGVMEGDYLTGGSTPRLSSDTGPIRATNAMKLCSQIMHMQRDVHPTILSALEGMADGMGLFRENWYEDVVRHLKQALTKCYAVAFECRGAVADANITPHTLNYIKKLVQTFGIGIENPPWSNSSQGLAASETMARRAQALAQDPMFQRMKIQFSSDFDFSQPGATKLHNLIHKLKKWIRMLEARIKLMPRSFLVEERCRFLSNFSLQTAEVELPGEFLLPKHTHYYVRIARFLPRVEIVYKHNGAARRLYIRGHNGKVYPYLVVNDSSLNDARREERVLQLLRMLNHLLTKQKESARRLLSFTVPRVVALSPHMRIVQDNESSLSLLDIYKRECSLRNVEYDAPLTKYYDRLRTVQARGSQPSHGILRDILKDIHASVIPKTMLKQWAMQTFPDATDYWTFRKMFTEQMALCGFIEYVLHLTRMNPDMIYIHQDSGLIHVTYYKFDIDDNTGELDANRPVPFRLTPNLYELMSSVGVTGPLTASIISAAQCFAHPNFHIQAILRALLRDELIGWHKKKHGSDGDIDGETLVTLVNKAVTLIMNRLRSLASYDGSDSKVSMLVTAANSNDNLCRMDPAWHPWL